ncbi:MAG: hypothetical protein LBF72_02505 [Holosporales bacterium]|jgi:signal transduction protein with GAF and PtsI domain|nr:hypothetical protein [Holosporales bacterium]
MISATSKKRVLAEPRDEIIIVGETLHYGVAIGRSLFYEPTPLARGQAADVVSVENEKQKILNAIQSLRNGIVDLLAEAATLLTEDACEILEVYRMLVEDKILQQELLKFVEFGKTAFEATECMARDFKAKIKSDTFWHTRFYDLQYLLRQLRVYIREQETSAKNLKAKVANVYDVPNIYMLEPSNAGFPSKPQALLESNPTNRQTFCEKGYIEVDNSPLILIASYISPMDLLFYYKNKNIVGLLLQDKNTTSHTAIVARSLHIPTLGNIFFQRSLKTNDLPMLIDANTSSLYIFPSNRTTTRIQRKTLRIGFAEQTDQFTKATTKDDIPIDIYINANIKEDMSQLHNPVLKGVGLFRTEILFLLPEEPTDLHAQVQQYVEIMNLAGEKPVVFRTIDIANDRESNFFYDEVLRKVLPAVQKSSLQDERQYSKHSSSLTAQNKTLIDRSFFFKTQIRALLKARFLSNYQDAPVYILIPLVSDYIELKIYKTIIEAEVRSIAATLKPTRPINHQIKVGIMIEVPAIAYQIEKIQYSIDFAAIGTNDLFQFFFAANRIDDHKRLSQNVLAPTFLKFIGNIMRQLQKYSINAHVCGEMAGNPLSAMALLALGVRRLSVSPNAVPHISRMIQSLPLMALAPLFESLRADPYELHSGERNRYKNAVDVREVLQHFSKKYAVEVF